MNPLSGCGQSPPFSLRDARGNGACGRGKKLDFADAKNCKTSRHLPRPPARLPAVPDGQSAPTFYSLRDVSKIRRANSEALLPAGQTASLPAHRQRPLARRARQRRPTYAFAGGRLLLVGLPPSTPAAAPTETKRSAHAPYSWGMGASARSRRRWTPALPAGPLGARRPPCSCGARDCRASVENTGFPLVLSSLCRFACSFLCKNLQ